MSPTLPFTEGDNFSSLLLNTIWPEALPMNLGKNKHDESKRLVNSRYTELWDVLIDVPVENLGQPGWDYNLLGCTTCGGYRVLVLSGDINFNASDAAEPSGVGLRLGERLSVGHALFSWVSRGGVLVMTAPVLLEPGNNFSGAPWNLSLSLGERTIANVTGLQTADGTLLRQYAPLAAPQMPVFNRHANGTLPVGSNETVALLSLVTTDPDQRRLLPAVTQTTVGHGAVVVIHPPVAADIDRLGLLDWVLDNITDGITPFSFTGGQSQTLLNRRATGGPVTTTPPTSLAPRFHRMMPRLLVAFRAIFRNRMEYYPGQQSGGDEGLRCQLLRP